jgi:hypothetical protein
MVAGMAHAGMSDFTIRTELDQMVEAHPNRHAWDRLLIVTGRRTSDVVVSQIGVWVDEACRVVRAAEAGQLTLRNR